ncbi:MAG: Nicotinate-nucleotide--dimethylbenzimidazole phosphoribosyltransferase [Planctomycetaceae bacterium]|nr:Nicotinate-nucleotide--dimethylbenzimidazole phosphoribosyltransferase [Planctomycetaceae bacterium]
MSLSSSDIWQHLNGLTKPPGSLGRLEELAARLCDIQQTLSPQTSPRRLVIFAGDHGVVSAGVTVWPSAVTNLMLVNMCQGGAASTVLAGQSGTEVVLVNVGAIDDPITEPPTANSGVRYRSRRVCNGTRNLAIEPALTVDEFQQAWMIGEDEARSAVESQVKVVIAGEMGIGNTTPASCLAMLLADVPLDNAVGQGAGANETSLSQKRNVVEQAVARAREIWERDPVAAIASVAGLEIVAMAGFFVAAHRLGLTIILDGAVASSAALIAEHRSPGVSRSMIAAHLSTEPAHRAVLERLSLTPFLDWNMRLGEGTGALLLLPLLDAASAMISKMATLESFGISPKVTS